MLESKIQADIIKWLKKNNIYHFKTVASNKRGIPDIIALYRGTFIAIEVKTEKGKLSKLQAIELNKITESGGLAFVARSVEDVNRQFSKLIPHRNKL